MVNLSQNIKKYIAVKAINLAEIIGLIALMFYGIYITGGNSLIAFGSVIVALIVYWIIDSFISKGLNKLKIPDLDTNGKMKMNIIDTVYSIIFTIIIFLFFSRFIQFKGWVIIVFAGIILIKEIIKWTKSRKEIRTKEGKEEELKDD